MKKYCFILVVFLFLQGCVLFRTSSLLSPKVEIAHNQWIYLPQPHQMYFNMNETQILIAHYRLKGKEYSHTIQVEVEKTHNKIVIVGLTPWGGELFSVNYNGHIIKNTSLYMTHANVSINHMLIDFILTYARTALIKRLLKLTKIKLILKNNSRVFMLNKKTIIQIKYRSNNIVLNNFNLKYKIKIIKI